MKKMYDSPLQKGKVLPLPFRRSTPFFLGKRPSAFSGYWLHIMSLVISILLIDNSRGYAQIIPSCGPNQVLSGYLTGQINQSVALDTPIDMGTSLSAGTTLRFVYAKGPLTVWASTTSGGSYTAISSLPSTSTAAVSQDIILPTTARYIKLTGAETATVSTVAYITYKCVASAIPSCASGQRLVSYPVGATAVNGVASSQVALQGDGSAVSVQQYSPLVIDLGSVVTAGNAVDVTYSGGNTYNGEVVYVATSTSASGPFITLGTLPSLSASSTKHLTLPLDARYVQLTTSGGSAFSIDAVTYPVYYCVPNPVPTCPAGQLSVKVTSGATSVQSASGGTTPNEALGGTLDGFVADLPASTTVVYNMGSLLAAGTPLTLTTNYPSSTYEVRVAASASGPYVSLGFYTSDSQFTLPISAQYVQVLVKDRTLIDAITYPTYSCVASPIQSCASGQQVIAYSQGAVSAQALMGSVTGTSDAVGLADGVYATMDLNSSMVLDLGQTVAAGTPIRFLGSTTGYNYPLEVAVSNSASGPFQVLDHTVSSYNYPTIYTPITDSWVLPQNARYVRLVSRSQPWAWKWLVDGIVYDRYSCVSALPSCPAGQRQVSYPVGATAVAGNSGVTSANSALGQLDGSSATFTSASSLTLDLGSVVPAGRSVDVTYLTGGTGDNVMTVWASATVGGPYTEFTTLPSSTGAQTLSLTLPVDARYIKFNLATGGQRYYLDAVTYKNYTCVPSNVTSGFVFNDLNNNGQLDPGEAGIAGVTVKAYDQNGNLVATTTTVDGSTSNGVLTTGTYYFSGLTAGQPYRLEFSWPNLSQYVSTIDGNDSHTSVQFIQGVTGNNNFGLYVPSTVCSRLPDPRMVTGQGLTTGLSVVSFDYGDITGSSNITYDISGAEVGVPIGVGSQRGTNLIFMSPISTNLAGVFPQAPDGSSAIYVANYNGPNGTQSYQDSKLLVRLSDLGINVGPTYTSVGGNPFGVQGLGGLDLSEDGNTLYVINMSDGNLVKVDLSGVTYNQLPASAPTSAAEISIPSSLAQCTGGIYRPAAVKQYGGKIYVGGVCSAETSNSASDLTAAVLSYDPATGAWKNEFSFPLDFGIGSTMSPWSTGGGPVLLDLAFDQNGTMVLGVTDRYVYGAATSANQVGYIIGASQNPDGSYTLESQGVLGGKVGQSVYRSGSQNVYGPGGGWFFEQSGPIKAYHPFTFNGGLYINPNTNVLMAGSTDPTSAGQDGVVYMDMSTGLITNGLDLVGIKLSRITGTNSVCEATPYLEIGNRVWKDTNKNGIQDPGEPSLAGVTVQLADASGNVIATAVTDADGNYIFSNAPYASSNSAKYGLPIKQLTDYKLTITSLGSDPSTTGLTLTGISPAPGETAGATNTGKTLANNDAFLVNNLPTITLKTGVNGDVNHTYDFGFIGSIFDLALTKKVATGQASIIKPGSQVTFTVTVYNQGTQPAYNIQLTDYIPAGLTLNDANWTANGSLATLKTPISGSLAAGDSTKMNITFTVNAGVSGPIINKAEISSADNDTDPTNTPPTDVDSKPDQNPTNDAGGTPNSGSDNSINGNGTGTPGDTNPATDEDDEDPAIIYVQPCTVGANLLTTEAHCGKADGRATVTVNTGTAPYSYAWSTGASTSVVTGLSGGQTFTVTVTDANGCQDVLVGSIQSTGGPSLTATATAASCQQATGSATVSASGGTAPYSYLWSTGATTATLSNVASGTYTVKVTDAAGCISSVAVIVPSSSPISAVATPTSASCLGANGGVTLVVSGGTAPYSYVWDNGATTQNLTGVAGGTYKVKVTDASGCTAVATAVVPTTGGPSVSGTVVNPLCYGTTTGSISVQASGGSGAYSYQWDNGATSQTLSNVQAGIYSVVVTDGAGCRSGASFTLVAPSRIVADIQSLSAVCNGQGSVTGGTVQVVSVVGGTPGYSYLWSDGSTGTSLTNLAAGTYSLTVTDSKGCIAVGQAVVDTWPTCAKASLGDYVWFDTNKNGQQDANETGVASVTAVLYNATTNQPISTTLTDANGKYLFTNLDPGSYYVKFTAPSGMTFTTANVGNDATDSDAGVGGQTGVYSLTAGQQDLTVDAGLIPLPASLGDYVWFDTNQNGQQDPTETGVASVTAILYDAVSGTIVSTTVTDGQGKYLFINLDPGSYYVKFTAPTGTTFTTANVGNDATDSDVASLTGQSGSTGVYSLTAGQQDLTVDAGLIPLKAALGDYVWYDNNKNGQQDPGEPPAVGVTVTLYNATTNQPISTTVTDGTGHYLFPNLDPGTYYVVFTAPSGATFTTPNSGNDTTDSDAGVGGKTGNYTLVAGQVDLTVDAGLIPQCTSPNCFTINVK